MRVEKVITATTYPARSHHRCTRPYPLSIEREPSRSETFNSIKDIRQGCLRKGQALPRRRPPGLARRSLLVPGRSALYQRYACTGEDGRLRCGTCGMVRSVTIELRTWTDHLADPRGKEISYVNQRSINLNISNRGLEALRSVDPSLGRSRSSRSEGSKLTMTS